MLDVFIRSKHRHHHRPPTPNITACRANGKPNRDYFKRRIKQAVLQQNNTLKFKLKSCTNPANTIPPLHHHRFLAARRCRRHIVRPPSTFASTKDNYFEKLNKMVASFSPQIDITGAIMLSVHLGRAHYPQRDSDPSSSANLFPCMTEFVSSPRLLPSSAATPTGPAAAP